ncbi:TPA: hypothetical protein ACRZZH_001033 [Vibrio harveyi]
MYITKEINGYDVSMESGDETYIGDVKHVKLTVYVQTEALSCEKRWKYAKVNDIKKKGGFRKYLLGFAEEVVNSIN